MIQLQGRVDLDFVFSCMLFGVMGDFSSLPVMLVISILISPASVGVQPVRFYLSGDLLGPLNKILRATSPALSGPLLLLCEQSHKCTCQRSFCPSVADWERSICVGLCMPYPNSPLGARLLVQLTTYPSPSLLCPFRVNVTAKNASFSSSGVTEVRGLGFVL